MAVDKSYTAEERYQIKKDLMDNKIPERVFVNLSLGLGVLADYAGLQRAEVMWHPELLTDTVKEICTRFTSDVQPWGGNVLQPSVYQEMGAINIVMSEKGFMQHPNTQALLDEDLDDFIKDPLACIVEKCFPRIYKNLDYSTIGPRSQYTWAMMFMATADNGSASIPRAEIQKLRDEYKWYQGYLGNPAENCSGYTTFDLMTDQLRSFTEICKDLRRRPEQIMDCLEAFYPLSYKLSLPGKQSPYSSCGHALHMGMFLNRKQFEKFYWKFWKRENEDHAAAGIRTSAFCEGDWMPFLDYLQELPAQSQLQFEKGDPKIVKEKLGKRHILAGFFPISSVGTLKKEELLDNLKELLDIMMPGGNYEFKFDKSAISLADIDIDNMAALSEFLYRNGKFDNAGATAGDAFDSSLYTDSGMHDNFHSKYYRTWEQYKAANPNTPESARDMVMGWEEAMLKRMTFFLK